MLDLTSPHAFPGEEALIREVDPGNPKNRWHTRVKNWDACSASLPIASPGSLKRTCRCEASGPDSRAPKSLLRDGLIEVQKNPGDEGVGCPIVHLQAGRQLRLRCLLAGRHLGRVGLTRGEPRAVFLQQSQE